MNRRGFFGLFAAAAATAIALPELELLVPTRTIFLPPAGGWVVRGNRLLTIDMIVKEAHRVLTMNLEFEATMNLEFEALTKAFDPAFLPKATVVSSVVTIRRPLRYASKEIIV